MYPGHWASLKPKTPAVIDAASGKQLTWQQLNEQSNQVASVTVPIGAWHRRSRIHFYGEQSRILPHRLGGDALGHVRNLH